MEFDDIVIGAGSSGSVVASRQSQDPGVSVCLLEAGGPDDSMFIRAPLGFAAGATVKMDAVHDHTVPQPGLNGRKGFQPRGQVVGGSSAINAMVYCHGHRTDYDGWATEGKPGWDYASVLPYFQRAEDSACFGATDFHGQGGPLGVAYLRVADASFMPNITNGNTNAPRIMIGEKYADLLLENREALIEAINQDYGCRSRFETLLTELLQGQESALAAVRDVRRWMKPQRRALDVTQYPLAKAYVFPPPVGVVGVAVPWNFPIAMAFQPLICAFAAGNRAMVKMSENARHLARRLQTPVPRYFVPDKLAIFEDGGAQGSLGPLFTQLPFDHLFFTGSPQTGKAVMANCAANLTPITLELGGKSPCIVAPDFALDKAAERILWVKMLNAGQICTNGDSLFLPAGSEQAFIVHAQRILAQRYPDLPHSDYTAIIDPRPYDRLEEVLQDAIAKGAQAVPRIPGQQGDAARRIMVPVLPLGVHDSMQVMQRKIFGPLLPVMTYPSKEEVVDYIGARHSPLALYLYSHVSALQDYYLTQTLSGDVTINDSLLHAGLHSPPFGGVGHSGMGHYHGREGFLTFSKLRPLLRQSRLRTVDFLMPSYKGLASKILDAMLWRNREPRRT